MLRYSPDINPNPRTSAISLPSYVLASKYYSGIPLKRKYLGGSGKYYIALDISNSSVKRLPKRSIGNAIILLVLTLREVYKYKKVLLGPVGEIPSSLEHPI
jgi:hypothetical protein